jgi:apoptosis-inducing factor 3
VRHRKNIQFLPLLDDCPIAITLPLFDYGVVTVSVSFNYRGLFGLTDTSHRCGNKQLTLDDGRALSYSKLLLATGAAPKRPDFPGAELPHVKLLRTLEDCRGIITAAQAARNIVVVGGSFVGLEAAAALRDRGHTVAVVAPEAHPMAQIFGSQLAELIAAAHRDHDVEWHVGRKVEYASEHAVRLDDGTLLDADLLVVGIGVAPRVGLAQAAGVAVDDGV